MQRLHTASPQTTQAEPPAALYADLYAQPAHSTPREVFATQFTALGGYYIEVADAEALAAALRQFVAEHGCAPVFCSAPKLQNLLPADQLAPSLRQAAAALTDCRALVAQHGSVLMSALATRAASALPDWHVVVAEEAQICPTLGEALALVDPAESSMHSIISGASRTADIEKTLVMGAHGPKKICVFLVLSS